MKLFIKYMVSLRCKMAVSASLNKMGLHYYSIDLGEVIIKEELDDYQMIELGSYLKVFGLELMDNIKAQRIEKIKNLIIEKIHDENFEPSTNFTNFLSEQLHLDYKTLSVMFSEVTGITIQQYIIMNKIEKVKELLLYDELTLTEISYKLDYSSVAHLSGQFKKVTGLTPSYFKSLKKYKQRINLEDL